MFGALASELIKQRSIDGSVLPCIRNQRQLTSMFWHGGDCIHDQWLCHKQPGSSCSRGWSGGAKVLGKLSVPGRPTSLDDSRARAYCACSRCGWGLFGHFFSHLYFLFSFSLSLGDGPI